MATPVLDVCVIGSGASGGVLAKELAESGAKVALIEAGRDMKPEDFAFHTWPYEYPFKGTARGVRPPYYPREVTEAIRGWRRHCFLCLRPFPSRCGPSLSLFRVVGPLPELNCP